MINFIIDNSFFEISFVSRKPNSNQAGVSIKSRKSFLNSENKLDFSSSKIQFMSINIDEDIIDVFLLYNNKKVKSVNPNLNNYYRIITKDIGVSNDFKEISFTIVNNIQLTINIKFKNKFSAQSISVKDRLKFFNQKVSESKRVEPQYIPKKLKMPNFLQKSETTKEEPKIEEPINEEYKNEFEKEEEKIEYKENVLQEEDKENTLHEKENNQQEEIKNKEEVKNEDVNKNNDENQNKQQIQNNEENQYNEEKNIKEVNEEKKDKKDKKKQESLPKEEKSILKTNYYKHNDSIFDESPKTKPGKLKIPPAFLSQNKETPKIYKKETEKHINNLNEIKPEKQNEEIPIQEVETHKETEKIETKSEEIQTQQEEIENKTEEIPTPHEEIHNQTEEIPTPQEEIHNQTEEISSPQEEIKEQEKQPSDSNENTIKEEPAQEKKEEKKETNKPTPDYKKSKTTTEMEVNKVLKNTNTLPTVKEKENDDFVIIDDEEEEPKGEVYLEPSTYGEFIKDQKNKGIKHPYRETFCEGFFIASFPQKEGKVIEMSESFPAPCKHEECSKLPAMKPEIIFRYPLEDTKTLELNNLAASICFPTGIKVCYDENNGPINIKDYVTSITNQKGERYYMLSYHFYLKMGMVEYQQQYEEHPLKYNLRKFADAYIGLSEEELSASVNKIQENLEFSQELGFRDTIFIPFCICLISKYPYVQEMKKCLKSIYTILGKTDEENKGIIINDIIMYLIHALPIPSKNTKVEFLMPYFRRSIELDCPKLEDINIMNCSATGILQYFNIDNLILIFRLLITEKKILIIDEDYEKLSKVADGFISILYPFQWIHTYIPIMSDQMLKYLETFLPFLNGINKSLMGLVENVFKEGEIEDDDEVFLIYISEEKDKIRLSSSLKGKKKRLDKYISDNIPSLPSSLEKELRYKLKKAKYEVDDIVKYEKKSNLEKQNLELQIRDAFVDFFVEIFHDYAQYLSFLEEDTVFNKSLFLDKRKNDKKFYNDILDTQLFQQFTQNVVNEDVGYFNSKIALREENKKNKPLKNKDKIKQYYINPDFLGLKNENKTMKDLVKDVFKKYPELKSKNKIRIIEKTINIDRNKYNDKDCKIYMTPEEKEAKKEEKIEEKKEQKSTTKHVTNSAILAKIKMLNLNASAQAKKKEGLSEREKDNLKEYIKDYVAKIFKSEEINLEEKEKKDLLNKLTSQFGRDFFASLLSKNTSNVILLKENSFHLLWTLIYHCIINTLKVDESQVLDDIVLLIKSTKYFGITENGITETMFGKNKQKIQGVPKITQDNFWEKWYEFEIKRIEDPKDEDKKEIICNIAKTLIELELPKSLVKKKTDNINVKTFEKGTEMYKKTFDDIIKLIINAKYVSVAI